MHKDFADWYRLVSIDPQNVPLELRWRGVEAFAKKANKQRALEVVRLLFNKPRKSSDFDAEFRDVFKKIDDSFAMRGNDLEIEVLAGSTVSQILESRDCDLADFVGLAVICADFHGLREATRLSEIVDASYSYVHERSDQLRTHSKIPLVRASKIDLSSLKQQEATIASAGPQVLEALEQLNSLPEKLAVTVNTALASLERQVELLQEESNILWWLVGEHSRDLKKRISAVELPAASLVLGKELADHTLILPGPVAVEAFLDRMLLVARKKGSGISVTVREAVTAAPLLDWKKYLLRDNRLNGLDDICTIHWALKKSMDTEADSAWAQSFEQRTGIKAETSVAPVRLAMQIYRECLLLRTAE